MEQKVALVTGGIGYRRGGVPLLAEHQFLVAVCDIDRDKAETVARSIGGIGVECDVASPQSVQSAASRCEAELERLICPPQCRHHDVPSQSLTNRLKPCRRRVPQDAGVNLDGVFNGLQTCRP